MGKKQGKFLKKLIKREAKKEVRKTRSRSCGSEADHHREAGKTFLDWLRMKKGSNSKMRGGVKAKLDAQEAGNKPRTKVSKKAMKKCMYRKDYRYDQGNHWQRSRRRWEKEQLEEEREKEDKEA